MFHQVCHEGIREKWNDNHITIPKEQAKQLKEDSERKSPLIQQWEKDSLDQPQKKLEKKTEKKSSPKASE